MAETTTAVTTRDAQIATIEQFLNSNNKRLQEELQGIIDPKVVLRVSLSTIRRNDGLLGCTPESLLNAILQAGQIGLEPTGRYGGAWIVPFKNKKTGLVEAQMIPDYRGLMDLARRSEKVESFEADIIYAKDKYEYRRGVDPHLEVHPSLDQDRGAFLAAYAIAWLKGARHPQIELMNKGQIDAIKNRSKAGQDGPWVTDYERMALKTVIKRLCGLLPGASAQLRAALRAEDDTYDMEPVGSQYQRRGVTGLGSRLTVVTQPAEGGTSPAASESKTVDAELQQEPTEEDKQRAADVVKELAAQVRNGAEHAKVNGAWLKSHIRAHGGSILMTSDGKLDLDAQSEAILRALLADIEVEMAAKA